MVVIETDFPWQHRANIKTDCPHTITFALSNNGSTLCTANDFKNKGAGLLANGETLPKYMMLGYIGIGADTMFKEALILSRLRLSSHMFPMKLPMDWPDLVPFYFYSAKISMFTEKPFLQVTKQSGNMSFYANEFAFPQLLKALDVPIKFSRWYTPLRQENAQYPVVPSPLR